MNCGDDDCMTEKTEAKEFAYFSGLLSGRKNERERIIKLLQEMRKAAFSAKTEIGNSNAGALENAIVLIKGKEKK